jgi:hypothetical protein
MRFDVLRFDVKDGFAKSNGFVELAGLKRRHRVRKGAIHRRSSSQHFARLPFKIRLLRSLIGPAVFYFLLSVLLLR